MIVTGQTCANCASVCYGIVGGQIMTKCSTCGCVYEQPVKDFEGKLNKHYSGLAAGQCVVDGALLGDDHGHQYCDLEKHHAALIERLESWYVKLDSECKSEGIISSVSDRNHPVMRRDTITKHPDPTKSQTTKNNY